MTNIGMKIKITICTTIVVLIIPIITTIIYHTHSNNYLAAPPSNNKVYLSITASVKRIGGAGSVGNEWSYKNTINNTTFKSGEVVEISTKKPFFITSTITEHDSISDTGTATSKEYTFGKTKDYSKEIRISNNVRVDERGGRKNADAYALFTVNYTLQRVIPEDFTFFDVYFYTNNDSELYFLWGIPLLGVGCIAYIVLVIYLEKKRQTQLEAERKAEEERKFQQEKREFISSLHGKSLREVAGVPANITYKNGRPIDHNNEVYGSFTVYLSRNGNCFHGRKGCCSAYRPIHYIDAQSYYKTCSKCWPRYHGIPEWHTKYMELRAAARKYGVNDE
jgi:hypothetical protein